MGEKAAGDPDERPLAGELRAGLREEQEHDTDDADREPGDEQPAHLIGETDAALRLMELERREHDERDDQDGEQRRDVTRLEVPAVEFRVIGEDADRDDEERVGELERRLQQRRMLLEQVAAHRELGRGSDAARAAQASSTMRAISSRKRAGAKRSAFSRQASAE